MPGFVRAFESGSMATEVTLFRLFLGWMFFQIWTRGVVAQNTGVFYRHIDLGDSYPGYAISSQQPGNAMLLIDVGDQNGDGYGDFIMAPQGGYYPAADLSTTLSLRYGRPSLQNTIISLAAATDETLHGSFGAKYGFCAMHAPLSSSNTRDFVYALRAPISQNIVNIRFSNQGAINPNADDLSIVSDNVVNGCPLALGYLTGTEPEVIESWGGGTIVATPGPFIGISGNIPADFTAGNNGSARFSLGTSPYGHSYPMQYASLGAEYGALFVSYYDVTVGGKSFVGEIRVLNRNPARFGAGGSFTGWDKTIRCTQDPTHAQNCGQALAIGSSASKKIMATSWIDPNQGGIKIAVIFDVAQLLANANTQPIILETHLDGQQGMLVVGDSTTVVFPTALGLDFSNIRSNNNPDLVVRTPYNNPGIFVLFPDQLNGDTFNLNAINGYNGFTITGKTQHLTNQASFIETIGESAIFSNTPDCQNLVFSNSVPSGYMGLAQGLPFATVNTAVYVLNCHDLRETVSPSPSGPPLPSSSPSFSASFTPTQSIPASPSPSASESALASLTGSLSESGAPSNSASNTASRSASRSETQSTSESAPPSATTSISESAPPSATTSISESELPSSSESASESEAPSPTESALASISETALPSLSESGLPSASESTLASVTGSVLALVTASMLASVSQSASRSETKTLLAPISRNSWTDHPEYLAPAAAGGVLLISAGLIFKCRHESSKRARLESMRSSLTALNNAFFAEDYPKRGDIELTERDHDNDAFDFDAYWSDITHSSQSSPAIPIAKIDVPAEVEQSAPLSPISAFSEDIPTARPSSIEAEEISPRDETQENDDEISAEALIIPPQSTVVEGAAEPTQDQIPIINPQRLSAVDILRYSIMPLPRPPEQPNTRPVYKPASFSTPGH